MTVLYHPEFAGDIRRFGKQYAEVSPKLELRFRNEVDATIYAIQSSPTSAGHFVNTGSVILHNIRRRNLTVFPFFILYGLTDECIVFGSLIPSSSDPLTWLGRFK